MEAAPASQRRAFTEPTRLNSNQQRHASDAAKEPATVTLFAHPQIKTVVFSSTIVPASVDWGYAKGAGTVPWSTPSEQVKAIGPLAIYRLKSSDVACCFLGTGGFVISLFPRSQCWCVDGVARFAMRIQHYIYRFELPHETDEEKAALEDFKDVLNKILHYERAPCPFIRGFAQEHSEELPSPKSKGRRRPSTKARHWQYNARWRPEDDPDYNPHRPGSSGSFGDSDNSASDATEDEHHATPTDALAEPVSSLRVEKTRPGVAAVIKSFNKTPSQAEPTNSRPTRPLPDTGQRKELSRSASVRVEAQPTASASDRAMHARDESVATVTPVSFGRPATPPPDASSSLSRSWAETQPSPLTPPSSGTGQSGQYTATPTVATTATIDDMAIADTNNGSNRNNDDDDDDDDDNLNDAYEKSNEDATLLSSDAEREPLPLESQLEPDLLSAAPLAAVPEDAPVVQEATTATTPITPQRAVRESVRRRRTASPRTHQRFRSQEVPSYILDDISSSRAMARAPSSAATMNMLSKTYELMMSPPASLLQIMVAIAARIQQYGASSAAVFSVKSMMRVIRARGRALPGRWTSDDEDESGPEGENDDAQWAAGPNENDEDDFGVPLGVETPARNRRMDWGSGPVQ